MPDFPRCDGCAFWTRVWYLKGMGECRRITVGEAHGAYLSNEFDGDDLVTAPDFGCALHEVGVPTVIEEPPKRENDSFALDLPRAVPDLMRLRVERFTRSEGSLPKTITFRRFANLPETKPDA